MILMINFSWQSIIGRGWYLPWGIEHHRFSHFIECSFRSVWTRFRIFQIAPGLILSTSGWRPRPWVPWLIPTSWLLCGQFRKMTTMWPRREEFFEQAGLWRRVPTPDMMTVASQWFPANKVLLMTSPFAEKVLYMNWKSALILNGSKMQIRILNLVTHFKADNRVKIMI